MGENGLLTEETPAMKSNTSSNITTNNATAGDSIITGTNKITTTASRSSMRGRVSPPDVQSGVLVCRIPLDLHGDGRFLALDTFNIIVGCEAGHA